MTFANLATAISNIPTGSTVKVIGYTSTSSSSTLSMTVNMPSSDYNYLVAFFNTTKTSYMTSTSRFVSVYNGYGCYTYPNSSQVDSSNEAVYVSKDASYLYISSSRRVFYGPYIIVLWT